MNFNVFCAILFLSVEAVKPNKPNCHYDSQLVQKDYSFFQHNEFGRQEFDFQGDL